MGVRFDKKREQWIADFQEAVIEGERRVGRRSRRFFRTKSEANDCCEEMTRRYQEEIDKPIIKVPTLQEAAQAYLDHHFVSKSPHYKHNEAQSLEYWLAVLGPNRLLTELAPMEIDDVLTNLLNAERAHTTVSKYRSTFNGLWKFCRKRRMVDFDIMADVMEIKKRPKRKVVALTPEQCETLMAFLSPPAKRCFLLLLHLGLRAGELFGDKRKGRRPMHVEDVDWESDAVLVFSNREEGETKGHSERWIPLDDVTRAIFREAGTGPAVGNVEYWWFRDQIEKAAQRSGMGHATVHQLRHSFCSMNIQAGVPEAVVSAWLGHKDSQITKRYTHLNRVLNDEYRGKIEIGGMSLALVPRFSASPKTTTPDFRLEIGGLSRKGSALPTGLEPVS